MSTTGPSAVRPFVGWGRIPVDKMLEAKVYDHNGAEIGNSAGRHKLPEINFGSRLPLPFIARWKEYGERPNEKAPNTVEFEYDGQVWNMDDPAKECKVTKWERDMENSGIRIHDDSRRITCSFDCK